MKKLVFSQDNELTKENIQSKLSDSQIYEFYLGETINFQGHISSPFRDDKTPSLSFLALDDNRILWRDWGSPVQSKPEDVFSFVMKLYNCSFIEALSIINKDMCLGFGKSAIEDVNYIEIPKKKTLKIREKKNVEIERQDYTEYDLKYWNKYDIIKDDLVFFKIYSVKHFWIDGIYYFSSKRNNPIYAFEQINEFGEICYKIYMPMQNKKNKWRSNVTKNTIQGENNIDYSKKLLIITKSMKDVVVLYKLGYTSISFQSEVPVIPERGEEIIDKFKNIIVFYDNDEAGIEASNSISKNYNIKQIFIPLTEENKKTKDISDYVEIFGLDNAKILLNNLINGAKIFSGI